MKRTMIAVCALAMVLVSPAVGKPHPSGQSSTATIAASPNPIVFGSSTVITGTVTGKKAAGATVQLQSEPAPFKSFSTAATAKADAAGHYSFKIAPGLNTIYRVTAKTAPSATSPNVLVNVRVKVTLRVGTTKPKRGQLVRFSGFVLPAYNGKSALIQHRTATGWRTVTRATLVAATPLGSVARSKFSKRVRIRKGGAYRVSFNPADNSRLPNTSPTRRLKLR